jgi:hypothetical protein
MGTTKQVGTWGSSTLLGYSIPKYGKTYYRIIEANKQAKKMGISYGKYMAGLWEKHDRAPIEFGNFTKYAKPSNKAQQKEALKVLKGNDAAEYIRKLKVKAGTYEEPKASAKYNSSADGEKAKLLNTKWSDACKELRENPEKVAGIEIVKKYKERKRPYDKEVSE